MAVGDIHLHIAGDVYGNTIIVGPRDVIFNFNSNARTRVQRPERRQSPGLGSPRRPTRPDEDLQRPQSSSGDDFNNDSSDHSTSPDGRGGGHHRSRPGSGRRQDDDDEPGRPSEPIRIRLRDIVDFIHSTPDRARSAQHQHRCRPVPPIPPRHECHRGRPVEPVIPRIIPAFNSLRLTGAYPGPPVASPPPTPPRTGRQANKRQRRAQTLQDRAEQTDSGPQPPSYEDVRQLFENIPSILDVQYPDPPPPVIDFLQAIGVSEIRVIDPTDEEVREHFENFHGESEEENSIMPHVSDASIKSEKSEIDTIKTEASEIDTVDNPIDDTSLPPLTINTSAEQTVVQEIQGIHQEIQEILSDPPQIHIPDSQEISLEVGDPDGRTGSLTVTLATSPDSTVHTQDGQQHKQGGRQTANASEPGDSTEPGQQFGRINTNTVTPRLDSDSVHSRSTSRSWFDLLPSLPRPSASAPATPATARSGYSTPGTRRNSLPDTNPSRRAYHVEPDPEAINLCTTAVGPPVTTMAGRFSPRTTPQVRSEYSYRCQHCACILPAAAWNTTYVPECKGTCTNKDCACSDSTSPTYAYAQWRILRREGQAKVAGGNPTAEDIAWASRQSPELFSSSSSEPEFAGFKPAPPEYRPASARSSRKAPTPSTGAIPKTRTSSRTSTASTASKRVTRSSSRSTNRSATTQSTSTIYRDGPGEAGPDFDYEQLERELKQSGPGFQATFVSSYPKRRPGRPKKRNPKEKWVTTPDPVSSIDWRTIYADEGLEYASPSEPVYAYNDIPEFPQRRKKTRAGKQVRQRRERAQQKQAASTTQTGGGRGRKSQQRRQAPVASVIQPAEEEENYRAISAEVPRRTPRERSAQRSRLLQDWDPPRCTASWHTPSPFDSSEFVRNDRPTSARSATVTASATATSNDQLAQLDRQAASQSLTELYHREEQALQRAISEQSARLRQIQAARINFMAGHLQDELQQRQLQRSQLQQQQELLTIPQAAQQLRLVPPGALFMVNTTPPAEYLGPAAPMGPPAPILGPASAVAASIDGWTRHGPQDQRPPQTLHHRQLLPLHSGLEPEAYQQPGALQHQPDVLHDGRVGEFPPVRDSIGEL